MTQANDPTQPAFINAPLITQRLLREGKWGSIQEAMEETYCVLNELESANVQSGPQYLVTPDGSATPPLTLQPSADSQPLQVKNKQPNGDNITLTNQGDLVINPNGPTGAPSGQRQPGIAGIAQILSGSGSTYSAALYVDGQDESSSGSGEVTQLQIASDETIPPGTWCLVVRIKDKYYTQVPVWL